MRCLCALLSLTLLGAVGCGGGDSASTAPATPSGTAASASAAEQQYAKHPAAVSSSKFLNAVVQGDKATAMGRLTPVAAKQLEQYDQTFSFSMLDDAKFTVTGVREQVMDTEEAAVEYHMVATIGEVTEEWDLACVMKQVNGDWRLSGMIFDLGDGQEPMIVNYEAAPAPATKPAAQPADPAQTVTSPAPGGEVPQTAQNPAGTQIR